MQPGARLFSSLEDGHPLQALRRSERCEAGQHWRWDGVDFAIVHPAGADYAARGVRPNALSCVLRVANGEAAVLLAGDVEKAQEAVLAREAGAVRADLLLVPHHGSKTSSSEVFLDAVRPSLALVQSGYRNRFGHPAAEVMERYRLRDIAVESSPHCGAAAWRSTEPARLRCERETAPRYWQHRAPPPVWATR
jgi:competence protein ComEC